MMDSATCAQRNIRVSRATGGTRGAGDSLVKVELLGPRFDLRKVVSIASAVCSVQAGSRAFERCPDPLPHRTKAYRGHGELSDLAVQGNVRLCLRCAAN